MFTSQCGSKSHHSACSNLAPDSHMVTIEHIVAPSSHMYMCVCARVSPNLAYWTSSRPIEAITAT